MKLTISAFLVFGLAGVAFAQAELKISPIELATQLSEMNKVVALSADAKYQVSADRAIVRLSALTEGKLLNEALEKNQLVRDSLREALVKQGIPEDRIKSSRFSSLPEISRFSGKVKNYKVENQLSVTIETEAQFQAVAAQIDARPELTYKSLQTVDSKESANKAQAVQQACEGANQKKVAVEHAMKVKLVPKKLAEGNPESAQLNVLRGAQGGTAPSYSGNKAVGFDWYLGNTPLTGGLRSEEGPGFGELTYHAWITVQFQLTNE